MTSLPLITTSLKSNSLLFIHTCTIGVRLKPCLGTKGSKRIRNLSQFSLTHLWDCSPSPVPCVAAGRGTKSGPQRKLDLMEIVLQPHVRTSVNSQHYHHLSSADGASPGWWSGTSQPFIPVIWCTVTFALDVYINYSDEAYETKQQLTSS